MGLPPRELVVELFARDLDVSSARPDQTFALEQLERLVVALRARERHRSRQRLEHRDQHVEEAVCCLMR